jgi:hypothetical protein
LTVIIPALHAGLAMAFQKFFLLVAYNPDYSTKFFEESGFSCPSYVDPE